MPVVDFQSAIDRYALALKVPRFLFQLYPTPRPQGRPLRQYSALPAAVTLGVIGAFEGFAEDFVAAAMVEQGHGWAQIAKNADLTNPSVKTLADKVLHTTGINVDPPANWVTALPKQTGVTSWDINRDTTWAQLLNRSESWIQVRHCLSHGMTTGLGAEVWPPPLTPKAYSTAGNRATASDADVLATVRGQPTRRGLYLWPSVACGRIFSIGAGVIAKAVASKFGVTVDVTALDQFSNI